MFIVILAVLCVILCGVYVLYLRGNMSKVMLMHINNMSSGIMVNNVKGEGDHNEIMRM